MRILSTLAKLILSFNNLPFRLVMVESRWITGHSLGQKPGGDIDSDIESFVERDSARHRTQDT